MLSSTTSSLVLIKNTLKETVMLKQDGALEQTGPSVLGCPIRRYINTSSINITSTVQHPRLLPRTFYTSKSSAPNVATANLW